MTGYNYIKRLAQMINDSHPSETWMDKKFTFDVLYQAAKEYVTKSRCLRSVQNITTVGPKTITGVSAANPCSITCAGHGLVTGDHIMIKDVVGTTELNDRRFVVTWASSSAFTLNGIDSTNLTAYVSGGKAYKLSYLLNYDFNGIYTMNPETGEPCLYFFDGTNNIVLKQEDYDSLIYTNGTSAATQPESFSIVPTAAVATLASTTSATGAQAGGESVLTDATATRFTSVNPGDEVINKTNSYVGIVLAQLTGTTLNTAMFNLASNLAAYASWGAADNYLIVPRMRYNLILDAPLSAGYDTISINYIQSPPPVYSDYGTYMFPLPNGEEAILNYAAWLYKFRDKEADFGNLYYRNWLRMSGDDIANFNTVTGKKFKKANYRI